MTPFEIAFAVNKMLGRLARMSRLLGCDALYANNMTAVQLLALTGLRAHEPGPGTARR